jgi:PEP-CTERM motif
MITSWRSDLSLRGEVMKLKEFATALAYGALLQSTVAFAATETVGTGFGFNTSPPTFALPAFDPALGTLTGVELDVDSLNLADIDVFSFQDEPQAFTATADVSLDIIGPDGANVGGMGSGEFDGTSGGFGSIVHQIVFVALSGTASVLDVNAYEGGSPLEISYSWSAGTNYSVTPSGTLSAGGFTQGSANFSVVYTYTPTAPVPEPSTWAMMLVGFAGLGFAGYRRTREQRATVGCAWIVPRPALTVRGALVCP